MFEAAFAELGLEGWAYQLLPVPPELFEETVRGLPAAGFVGANVTIPHKEAALTLADSASPRATAIGAANTLLFRDGAIEADNTDAPGLIAALPEPPAGKTALVLGAGGSARAAVWALLDAGAGEVMVWNRRPPRAAALCATLGGRAVDTPQPADLLVNCTPVGLGAEDLTETFKQLCLSADALREYRCVADLAYAAAPTALIAAAEAAGATVVDGLEVLVCQGALSFEQFTGRPAPTDAMREAARRG
jgi:shikimate dehydrogenase